MNRDEMIKKLNAAAGNPWDVLIIGGGATGLGAAVDAASRGYQTLLLEQRDFAQCSSSRSTKLIHGGFRYLRHGDISLVKEGLRERGTLLRIAPHLVHPLPFVVPSYSWWEKPFYGLGMKIYDLLAWKRGLPPSRSLSLKETLKRLPTLQPKYLRGGTLYYDGQFDDARFAITLAQTAADLGATLLNYAAVTSLIKENGKIAGVSALDRESGTVRTIRSKTVINATGVFSDTIRGMDTPTTPPLIQASQGIHLVFDRSLLDSDTAIIIPHTDDSRILFLIPWHGRVLAGTTETPVKTAEAEPKALEKEIEFILAHAAKYLTRPPTRSDILSIYAGLRPLISNDWVNTAFLSRKHALVVSDSGLITITGGKWTTYRQMGEDAVDKAIALGALQERASPTASLKLHGWEEGLDQANHLSVYGSDKKTLQTLMEENPHYKQKIDPSLPYQIGQIVWAVRYEMARTIEDVLSRRLRLLFLDAGAAIKAAPLAARTMAIELGKDKQWETEQVSAFEKLANHYLAS